MTFRKTNPAARKHQGENRQRNNRWFGAGLFSCEVRVGVS